MEDQHKSPVNTAMKWGLILGLVGLITTLALYLTGNYTLDRNTPNMYAKGANYLSIAVMIFCVLKAQQDHRDKDLGGFMSYGRGLGTGTLVGLFSGILVGLFTFVLIKFIQPDLVDQTLQIAEEQMREKNPNMTDEQIEMGLGIARKFTSPVAMAFFGLLGQVFLAFVISLLIAAFISKKNPEATV